MNLPNLAKPLAISNQTLITKNRNLVSLSGDCGKGYQCCYSPTTGDHSCVECHDKTFWGHCARSKAHTCSRYSMVPSNKCIGIG